MIRFIKSMGYAMCGIIHTFKTERSFKIQVCAMLLVLTAGIYVNLSIVHWGFVIFAIGFVLTCELFNTALERLSDQTTNGKIKPLIKQAKDISAGAVMVSAATALVIGIIFLIIPLVNKIIATFG